METRKDVNIDNMVSALPNIFQYPKESIWIEKIIEVYT
jgi:hypothetical protein